MQRCVRGSEVKKGDAVRDSLLTAAAAAAASAAAAAAVFSYAHFAASFRHFSPPSASARHENARPFICRHQRCDAISLLFTR